MAAGNAAAGAAARDPSGGEAGFRQLAECAATVEATARLYAVLATGETGSRKGELERTAAARRSSAMVLELDARMAGQALGHSIEDVTRIKAERHARLEQERERLADFGEFAIWLGRETDRCAALYPTAG
jgi:hypothetical protein